MHALFLAGTAAQGAGKGNRFAVGVAAAVVCVLRDWASEIVDIIRVNSIAVFVNKTYL